MDNVSGKRDRRPSLVEWALSEMTMLLSQTHYYVRDDIARHLNVDSRTIRAARELGTKRGIIIIGTPRGYTMKPTDEELRGWIKQREAAAKTELWLLSLVKKQSVRATAEQLVLAFDE